MIEDTLTVLSDSFGKVEDTKTVIGPLNPYLGDFGNVRERHFWTKNPELLFRF